MISIGLSLFRFYLFIILFYFYIANFLLKQFRSLRRVNLKVYRVWYIIGLENKILNEDRNLLISDRGKDCVGNEDAYVTLNRWKWNQKSVSLFENAAVPFWFPDFVDNIQFSSNSLLFKSLS